MARARVPAKGVTVDDVRALALALPGTTERPSYGTPGFRVHDKLFARVLDDETIVAKVDLEWRDDLVLGSPDVFHVTPHYQSHPWVVVRLPAITREQLSEVLASACELATPRPRGKSGPSRR